MISTLASVRQAEIGARRVCLYMCSVRLVFLADIIGAVIMIPTELYLYLEFLPNNYPTTVILSSCSYVTLTENLIIHHRAASKLMYAWRLKKHLLLFII